MHLKYLLIFVVSILLYSCNTQRRNAENTNSQPEVAVKQSDFVNCYQYADKNDTISLKVIHVGSSITGLLIRNLKKKTKIPEPFKER